MRPRLIGSVPGLDPYASPFERFQQFAQRIVKVSKVEADMEIEKSGPAGPKTERKRKKK